MKSDNKKEPLIHITKRSHMPLGKALLIRFLAIVLSLLVCALVIVALTEDLDPIEVYKTMIQGSFSTTRKFWVLLQNTAMLLSIALAVTPAFKMRFWNLGAEGQVLVGGLAAVAIMRSCADKWTNLTLILIMAAAAILAGMIWAGIPAFFKARFGTNESLFTLMLNYVATQLVTFSIASWVTSGSGVLGVVNSKTQAGWLPSLFGQKYMINVLVSLVLMIFMFIYLTYSKHGYELAVVGESENTARYIGINVKKVILRTAALSGGIAGLTGFLLVSGSAHSISASLAGGNGFTAILVSWLAKFNPIIMIFTSMLITFMRKGAGEIAQTFRLSDNISDIVTGIILFFIIGSEFFIGYKINFRKKAEKEDK